MQMRKYVGTMFAAFVVIATLLAGCSGATPEPLAEMTPIEATVAAPAETPGATAVATTAPTMTVASPTTAPTATVATEPAATEPAATEPAATETAVSEEAAGQPDTGMAVVENVDVRILESFPVQVQTVVTGYLPDGCTTIATAEAVQEDNTFRIVITTDRPADAMCTMATVPFEEVVPLATADLPAGDYQVVVNDLTASFTLPEGNAAPEGEAGPEAGVHPVVETPTEFVQAQVDVPMFDAPAADANEIGMVAGGQIARVTGASEDGTWWRVICPDDSVGDCWVSAAPEMTLPTTPP